MDNIVQIEGIYHSNEYKDSWIIKKEDGYYAAPALGIRQDNLEYLASLDEKQLRPVGENVEQLLLNRSDMVKEAARHKIGQSHTR